MHQLPVEIIEDILSSPKLSTEDVVNFSQTCHHFYTIVKSSNKIWKTKIFQRWPDLKRALRDKYEVNFPVEVQYIYNLRKRTRELLEKMPPKLYKKYEVSDSDLDEWTELLNETEEIYDYLVVDLMEIINSDLPIKSIETIPFNTPGNKTLQYYANKVLRHIRQLHLSKVWDEYMSLPPERQILEIGAVIVAQWCQPNVEIILEEISAQLDEIAEKIKIALHAAYPDHSLFKILPEQFSQWRIENKEANEFNTMESKQLLCTMRDVMFQQLGFQGNNHAYYMPQNSFINEVLEKRQGLPITLAIIFEAVARRLGLRCEPISFPAHFLLRFCEGKSPHSDWYYIDVFNGGRIIRRGACPHSKSSGMFPIATAIQVIERMANNLEMSARHHEHPNGRTARLRSSLELLKLVNAKDISTLISLARLYMFHNMDTRNLEKFIMSQQFEIPEQAQRVVHMLRDYSAHFVSSDMLPFKQIKVAIRSDDLKFAVGMIMKHGALGYRCVIYDWDPECLASVDWQRQNEVHRLSLQGRQPFYNVLVEDGSHKYVAQENLHVLNEPADIFLNEDIGRHFSHFFDTHYVPNAEKEKEYPGDKQFRYRWHQKLKLNSVTIS